MSVVSSEFKRLGLMSLYSFLNKDPEKNLPRLMTWLDRYLSPELLKTQREFIKEIIEDKENHWYKLITSVWSDIDDDMRKTLFENVIINANAFAASRAEESREKYGCNIPWIVAIELEDEEGSLDFDDWDNIIEQAKELGTFIFLFQGGEPLNAKEEIIALCNKHAECEFMMFTDGKQLDAEFAEEVLRVKNLIITVRTNSVKELDEQLESLELMRKYKLPYAVSVLYDAENQDEVGKEAFVDKLIANGVKLGLFLSSLSDEEDELYKNLQEFRKSKPIFTIDFCKDSAILGGCVAGGKYYCHVNGKGDVEPCFFMSLSDTNLKTNSLVDAYRAPLFMEYKQEEKECAATKN